MTVFQSIPLSKGNTSYTLHEVPELHQALQRMLSAILQLNLIMFIAVN